MPKDKKKAPIEEGTYVEGKGRVRYVFDPVNVLSDEPSKSRVRVERDPESIHTPKESIKELDKEIEDWGKEPKDPSIKSKKFEVKPSALDKYLRAKGGRPRLTREPKPEPKFELPKKDTESILENRIKEKTKGRSPDIIGEMALGAAVSTGAKWALKKLGSWYLKRKAKKTVKGAVDKTKEGFEKVKEKVTGKGRVKEGEKYPIDDSAKTPISPQDAATGALGAGGFSLTKSALEDDEPMSAVEFKDYLLSEEGKAEMAEEGVESGAILRVLDKKIKEGKGEEPVNDDDIKVIDEEEKASIEGRGPAGKDPALAEKLSKASPEWAEKILALVEGGKTALTFGAGPNAPLMHRAKSMITEGKEKGDINLVKEGVRLMREQVEDEKQRRYFMEKYPIYHTLGDIGTVVGAWRGLNTFLFGLRGKSALGAVNKRAETWGKSLKKGMIAGGATAGAYTAGQTYGERLYQEAINENFHSDKSMIEEMTSNALWGGGAGLVLGGVLGAGIKGIEVIGTGLKWVGGKLTGLTTRKFTPAVKDFLNNTVGDPDINDLSKIFFDDFKDDVGAVKYIMNKLDEFKAWKKQKNPQISDDDLEKFQPQKFTQFLKDARKKLGEKIDETRNKISQIVGSEDFIESKAIEKIVNPLTSQKGTAVLQKDKNKFLDELYTYISEGELAKKFYAQYSTLAKQTKIAAQKRLNALTKVLKDQRIKNTPEYRQAQYEAELLESILREPIDGIVDWVRKKPMSFEDLGRARVWLSDNYIEQAPSGIKRIRKILSGALAEMEDEAINFASKAKNNHELAKLANKLKDQKKDYGTFSNMRKAYKGNHVEKNMYLSPAMTFHMLNSAMRITGAPPQISGPLATAGTGIAHILKKGKADDIGYTQGFDLAEPMERFVINPMSRMNSVFNWMYKQAKLGTRIGVGKGVADSFSQPTQSPQTLDDLKIAPDKKKEEDKSRLPFPDNAMTIRTQTKRGLASLVDVKEDATPDEFIHALIDFNTEKGREKFVEKTSAPMNALNDMAKADKANEFFWRFVDDINFLIDSAPKTSDLGGAFDDLLGKGVSEFHFNKWLDESVTPVMFPEITVQRAMTGRIKMKELETLKSVRPEVYEMAALNFTHIMRLGGKLTRSQKMGISLFLGIPITRGVSPKNMNISQKNFEKMQSEQIKSRQKTRANLDLKRKSDTFRTQNERV